MLRSKKSAAGPWNKREVVLQELLGEERSERYDTAVHYVDSMAFALERKEKSGKVHAARRHDGSLCTQKQPKGFAFVYMHRGLISRTT